MIVKYQFGDVAVLPALCEALLPRLFQMELAADLETVPFEVIATKILQLVVDPREHPIPIGHRRHDNIVEMLVHQLYLQVLQVSEELSYATPAIIIEFDFPPHCYFVHFNQLLQFERRFIIDRGIIDLHR